MKWTGREAKADRDANAPPDVTTLAAFPAGRRFSSLAFACGGKQIGFLLDGVVGVMSADGTGWRGLSGPLPLDPVPPEQGIRSHRKQTISLKSPGGPLHASGGFISCLSHDEKGPVESSCVICRTGVRRSSNPARGICREHF